MSKSKDKIDSIYNIPNYLSEDQILPIYFLFGEDEYTISQIIKEISKKVEPLVTVDFDREVITLGKESSSAQIIDLASSFPFGDGKKIIVAKNFENCNDKKNLIPYVKDPSDFTILILTQSSKKVNINNEPYKSLYNMNFLFESSELKGQALQQWLIKEASKEKMELDLESAKVLVEMVGENKALLEMQLTKFRNYLGHDKKITPEIIESLTSVTKEFTIFNLQDALGKGDKGRSIEIGYNLLDGSYDLVFLISMLTKYITTVTQILEIKSKKMSDQEGAKETGTSFYYYINCKKASFLLNEKRLMKASKALLNADINLKTTSADKKDIFTILISEILN